MRYIEARPSKYTMELLEGIDKNAVEFVPNYDRTKQEPTYLPSKYPNILINGNIGMGIGYASNIPPFNFVEVLEICKKLLKNPDLEEIEIAKKLRPDFPTGGTIINNSSLTEALMTGSGIVKIQGKITYDEKRNELLISEIPYLTRTKDILDKLQEAYKEGNLTDINKITDLTSKENGICIKLGLKRGSDYNIVKNLLFKHTPLRTGLSYSFILTDGSSFKKYSIKEFLVKWLDFRKNTIRRISNFDISKIRRRLHIIEGLEIIYSSPHKVKYLDYIIKLMKQANDRNHAIELLQTKFYEYMVEVEKDVKKLTTIQAESIVDTKLHNLSRISFEDLINEKKDLTIKLDSLVSLLSHEKNLINYIIKEFDEGIKKYGSKRKTTLMDLENEDIEDLITNDPFDVIVTKQGFIKKIKKGTIKAQGSGGQGRSIGKIKEDDCIKFVLNCNNKDVILAFTNKGRIFPIKLYEIQETNLMSYGISLSNYLKLDNNEEIIFVTSNEKDNIKGSLVFLTKKGYVKQTELSLYSRLFNIKKKGPSSGLISIKLNENDSLIDVKYVEDYKNYDLVACSYMGNIVRYPLDNVPIMLRTTQGVTSMKLEDEKDYLISLEIIKKDDIKGSLVVINEKGNGKKVQIKNLESKKRSSFKNRKIDNQGNIIYVGYLPNREDTELVIVSKEQVIKLNTKEIKGDTRYAICKQPLIKLNKGDKVINARLY